MPSLLSLKKRITTAQNISKTTRAMQLIAASKLKRAQAAALAGRPYIEKLGSVTQQSILQATREIESPYLATQNDKSAEIAIIFAPDKGLCGSLVSSILLETYKLTKGNKNLYLVLVGNKLEKIGVSQNILASFQLGTRLPSFDVIFPVLQVVEERFLKGEAREVKVLYPKYISLFTQAPTTISLLPLKLSEDKEEPTSQTFKLFEPSLQDLAPSLLRHYLEINFYQFFLETYLSEQAARMISMKNATDNATDVIEDLRLEYNKTRQEKITNEILDIGSAALALTL